MYEHQLEKIDGTWRCAICRWDWTSKPASRCPGVPRIHAEYLLTYTQLRQKALMPLDRNKPDACYYRSSTRDFVWLYDERQALPRSKETEAQKAGHAKAWATTQEKYRCPRCNRAPASPSELKLFHAGGLVCTSCAEWQAYEDEQREIEEQAAIDYRETSQWATDLLARNDWVVLDTETTDLDGYLCEIAVVGADGTVLFHSLINPAHPVDVVARMVHQITDEELAAAPSLPEVWPALWESLAGKKTIVTFNVDFDRSTIERDGARYGLSRPKFRWECLMLKYAAWCGNWSEYHGSYTWQPLPGGTHRATGDALAAHELIKVMASHLGRADHRHGACRRGRNGGPCYP
jgi:DNA polymerase III subunit epsilon